MGFPLILQDKWLLEAILSKVDEDIVYSNAIIDKNFVKSVYCLEKTPVLRIFKFLKITESHDLTLILSDSHHKILARVLQSAIFNFELKYSYRITYQTLNSLVILRKTALIFVNKFDLAKDFDYEEDTSTNTIVLDILDLDIFQRDQVQLAPHIELGLKFLYNEDNYRRVCLRKNTYHLQCNESILKGISQDYDDLRSI